MQCGITGGLSVDCDALRRVGGVNKRAFVGNLSDVESYTTDVDGCITAITFAATTGLYELESRKASHSGGITAQVSGEGGNKFYTHDVQLKLFSSTCAEDKIIEELLVANLIIILETNNKEFLLFGQDNGMEQASGSQNSGQVAATDISDTLIFIGEESAKPKRVLDADYATTKALLTSYVVV